MCAPPRALLRALTPQAAIGLVYSTVTGVWLECDKQPAIAPKHGGTPMNIGLTMRRALLSTAMPTIAGNTEVVAGYIAEKAGLEAVDIGAAPR